MAEQDVLEAALAEISALQQAHWPAGIPRAVEYPLEGGGLVDYLRHWAIERPDTPAIVFYGRVITYSEYDELSDRFAGWLLSLGVERGDRVGVHLVNCPQFHIAMLGILKVGAVHVPINPLFREHELIHELNDAGVKVLLTQNTFSKLVKKVRSQTPLEHVAKTAVSDMLTAIPTVELPFEVDDPRLSDWQSIITSERATPVATELDSLAALNYTGGTTGMPKGCEHTQRHMVYTAATATLAGGDQVGANPPVSLVFLPIFWIAGEDFGILVPLVNGGTVVLLNRWDAETTLDAVEAYGVTSLVGTVDNYVELMDTPGFAERNLSTLQNVMAVSFVLKLDPATRQRWREATGGVLREASYGMTETHTADTITLGFQDGDYDLKSEPVFCGIPVPGTDVLIVDHDGRPVPVGEHGQIIVRSPSILSAYYRNEVATADAIRDGWLQTGDVGKFSERGGLHYLARNNEM
ncbi:MAG: AMP-binding protein, partial [Rhodococcus sp.]|nr:AMP-binding protein [Rhodococcus sp. (in: high G+C Gram-positive bacteria)]